jgi:RNA recognition motif-containing protein
VNKLLARIEYGSGEEAETAVSFMNNGQIENNVVKCDYIKLEKVKPKKKSPERNKKEERNKEKEKNDRADRYDRKDR